MRKMVADLGDAPGAKNFKAFSQWFHAFRKKWGFSFQTKTAVKKKSLRDRLPYVRKYHQHLLNTVLMRSNNLFINNLLTN